MTHQKYGRRCVLEALECVSAAAQRYLARTPSQEHVTLPVSRQEMDSVAPCPAARPLNNLAWRGSSNLSDVLLDPALLASICMEIWTALERKGRGEEVRRLLDLSDEHTVLWALQCCLLLASSIHDESASEHIDGIRQRFLGEILVREGEQLQESIAPIFAAAQAPLARMWGSSCTLEIASDLGHLTQRVDAQQLPLVLGRGTATEDGEHKLDLSEFADPEHPLLSRDHARLDLGINGLSIRDLGSRNGTYVNGECIGSRSQPASVDSHLLDSGDEIRMGEVTITIRVEEGA